MGLAYYNPLESLQKPDPLLTWNVPKSWSLEDATTVPLLYAQVRILFCNLVNEQKTSHKFNF